MVDISQISVEPKVTFMEGKDGRLHRAIGDQCMTFEHGVEYSEGVPCAGRQYHGNVVVWHGEYPLGNMMIPPVPGLLDRFEAERKKGNEKEWEKVKELAKNTRELEQKGLGGLGKAPEKLEMVGEIPPLTDAELVALSRELDAMYGVGTFSAAKVHRLFERLQQEIAEKERVRTAFKDYLVNQLAESLGLESVFGKRKGEVK